MNQLGLVLTTTLRKAPPADKLKPIQTIDKDADSIISGGFDEITVGLAFKECDARVLFFLSPSLLHYKTTICR